jgi:hypothetical protein
MQPIDLTALTDDALVARVSTLCAEGHVLTARIIVHLIEVEDRRHDLRAACTSMFDFCQRKLGMSEGAAFRRITAARIVKRFPSLLGRVEKGELGLSALVLLRDHLTPQNVEQLADAVVGKTRREIEELLARLAPRPDVPVRIQPLSEARYKVQLTASAELKAKLERACDLMRHRNPSGDLAVVLDAAMDVLLAKLEKERLAKVKTPRQRRQPSEPRATRATRATRGRAIPAPVRREVFARDGEQCTFHSAAGERCPQRGHLELDHVEAWGLGGANTPSNLRVRCRAHNRLAAEDIFGKAHVAERIDFRQRKSDPAVPQVAVQDLAVQGLHNLGFKKTDAQRAVDHVLQTRVASGEPLVIQDLLRGAIAELT